MAFLQASDISSSLPAGYDIALVDRLLVTIEADLLSMNLAFNPISATTRELETYLDSNLGYHINSQSVFGSDYMQDIASIKIKQRGETGETVLTLNSDFTLVAYSNLDNYYQAINLIHHNISNPNYLEVTAKFGLYIDFADTSSIIAKLLKAGVTNYIINQLNLKKNTNGLIQSASEAGSSITYSSNSMDLSRNIQSSPDFQSIFSYLC
jgi:hypothetical protein